MWRPIDSFTALTSDRQYIALTLIQICTAGIFLSHSVAGEVIMRRETLDEAKAFITLHFLKSRQNREANIADFFDTSSEIFIRLAESITDMLMVLDPGMLEHKDILRLKQAQSDDEAFENRYDSLIRSKEIFVIDAQGTIHEQKKRETPASLKMKKLNTLLIRLQALEEQ